MLVADPFDLTVECDLKTSKCSDHGAVHNHHRGADSGTNIQWSDPTTGEALHKLYVVLFVFRGNLNQKVLPVVFSDTIYNLFH